MSVRFDSSADQLTRTSDLLNYNAVYTIMAWVYISVDRNDYGTFFALSSSSDAVYDWVGPGADGTTLTNAVNAGGYQENGGTNLSTATWYHVAVVRASTTSLIVYLNGVQDSTNSQSVSGRAAVANNHAGRMGGDFLNGRMGYIKAWSTNLSTAEILNEMRVIQPLRTANLYGWWPTLAGTQRTMDYSGLGRDWTVGGTLTDEDDAPVAWGAAPYFIHIPAASGGQAPRSLHQFRMRV